MDCQDPQVHYCFALVIKDATSLVMFAVLFIEDCGNLLLPGLCWASQAL